MYYGSKSSELKRKSENTMQKYVSYNGPQNRSQNPKNWIDVINRNGNSGNSEQAQENNHLTTEQANNKMKTALGDTCSTYKSFAEKKAVDAEPAKLEAINKGTEVLDELLKVENRNTETVKATETVTNHHTGSPQYRLGS